MEISKEGVDGWNETQKAGSEEERRGGREGGRGREKGGAGENYNESLKITAEK